MHLAGLVDGRGGVASLDLDANEGQAAREGFPEFTFASFMSCTLSPAVTDGYIVKLVGSTRLLRCTGAAFFAEAGVGLGGLLGEGEVVVQCDLVAVDLPAVASSDRVVCSSLVSELD